LEARMRRVRGMRALRAPFARSRRALGSKRVPRSVVIRC
jgi:hypothetical protein